MCGCSWIAVSFTQKHELRQVYVRSTARVYEIYWAPDLHSINEYLCTVRCSVAAKDEKSLHATDIDEPASVHVEGSDEKLANENLKNGSSVCSNEDGWVEVKTLDSHPLENRSSSLQPKIIANAGSISLVCGLLFDIIDKVEALSCPVFLIMREEASLR